MLQSALKPQPAAPKPEDPNANPSPDQVTTDTSAPPLSPSTDSEAKASSDEINSNTSEEKKEEAANGNKSSEEDKENLQIDVKNLTEEEKKKLEEEDKQIREKWERERLLAEEQEYEKVRQRIEEAKRKRIEEQRAKEEMFWRIYYLVRHSGDRTVEDYFHRAVMSCFLLKAVQKTKYFEEYKASGVGKKNFK